MLTFAIALCALPVAIRAQIFSATANATLPYTNGLFGSQKTTISGLVGPIATDATALENFVASVSAYGNCSTTILYHCPTPSLCSYPTDVTFTATVGGTGINYAYSTSTNGGNLGVTNNCTLVPTGTSSATGLACGVTSAFVDASANFSINATTTTFNGDAYASPGVIPVTAGNLPMATEESSISSSCSVQMASLASNAAESTRMASSSTASGSSASSQNSASSRSGARPTVVAELYRVVVVPVGAALVAGAAFV